MEFNFSFQEIFTAFMVLFAVIDITGAIPVIVELNQGTKKLQAGKAALYSLIILVGFLFAGEALLKLFSTDIASFAIAGSLILFALAVEMTFNVELFKYNQTNGNVTLIPLVFPLVAGPGTLTTALSLRAEFQAVNIILAIMANLVLVYIVIKNIGIVEKLIGQNGIYISRKFFGVILLAMSVKLFVSNLRILIG
ncbi:MAG TPA: MarC family protein [Bacteroidales bacterium]|jgi:multiple antibiotic resistance protein|nr:MarC family protein [Bacteroidales bacterium]